MNNNVPYIFSGSNIDADMFYDEMKNLMINDLDYNIYSKHNYNKEQFLTVLYNLVVTMNDIYKKAPYYGFDKINKSLLTCMKVILDEMDVYVNNRDKNCENDDVIINSELNTISDENKVKVMDYFNRLEDIKDEN